MNSYSSSFASFSRKIAFLAAICLVGLSGCGGSAQPAVALPGITMQPANLTINAGATANFSVAASGDGTLYYQWKRNGANIDGATAASYVLPEAQLADSGSTWSVVVSNVAGSVTSTVATLTVNPGPRVSLLAGRVGGPGNIDGVQGRFMGPGAVVADQAGNIYVTDDGKIRKVSSSGVITTLAGITVRYGAKLAIDRADNLYVTDVDASVIRKITPAGVATIVAGAEGVLGSADGVGAAARFQRPAGIAADESGNLYVTDWLNHTVRKIGPTGTVTTLAGTPGVMGTADGIGAAASFRYPTAVAVDGSGNVYVAQFGGDSYLNNIIRKITPTGIVSTLAGNPGNLGQPVDGVGAAAGFSNIYGLTVDRQGNVYVTESNSHGIRKVTPAGVVTTLAGSIENYGAIDGTGIVARFMSLAGITVDETGHIYVADSGNYSIRKVSPAGEVTTLAGKARSTESIDGSGAAASFSALGSVAVDRAGNTYVSDNELIRKITPDGMVTTLAGNRAVYASVDGIGTAASFRYISGLAVDRAGNVYVTDFYTIRKVTPAGAVTTLAGKADWDSIGVVDGTGTAARFSFIKDLAVDEDGNIYVADNTTIRKVTPDGVVTTLAGRIGEHGASDGVGTAARFTNPSGIAVDRMGNVYVSDAFIDFLCPADIELTSCNSSRVVSNTIRRITPDGVVTTLVGTAGVTGSADGSGAAASFNYPAGIDVDEMGNIFVVDSGNSTIRKISQDGSVTTVAGKAGSTGVALGALPASLNWFMALSIGPNGMLYVTPENAVLKIALE